MHLHVVDRRKDPRSVRIFKIHNERPSIHDLGTVAKSAKLIATEGQRIGNIRVLYDTLRRFFDESTGVGDNGDPAVVSTSSPIRTDFGHQPAVDTGLSWSALTLSSTGFSVLGIHTATPLSRRQRGETRTLVCRCYS